MERVSIKIGKKAHRVFRDIAHQLSNGSIVRMVQVFDVLAAQKEEIIKLVKKELHK